MATCPNSSSESCCASATVLFLLFATTGTTAFFSGAGLVFKVEEGLVFATTGVDLTLVAATGSLPLAAAGTALGFAEGAGLAFAEAGFGAGLELAATFLFCRVPGIMSVYKLSAFGIQEKIDVLGTGNGKRGAHKQPASLRGKKKKKKKLHPKHKPRSGESTLKTF